MRLLDLFCGAGGAAMGYHRAGFEVVGVDIKPQAHYPFRLHIGDVLESTPSVIRFHFDAIHASPPCQGYTTMNNRRGLDNTPRLIGPVRELLEATGLPYVIENVEGAKRHMRNPIRLHGGHFGIGVYRPRFFESNIPLVAPPKAPRPMNAAAVYGKNDGRRVWTRKDGTELRCASLDEARAAMEMPWADWDGVREAIPPAYTEYIGRQLLAHLGLEAVA